MITLRVSGCGVGATPRRDRDVVSLAWSGPGCRYGAVMSTRRSTQVHAEDTMRLMTAAAAVVARPLNSSHAPATAAERK